MPITMISNFYLNALDSIKQCLNLLEKWYKYYYLL